MLVQCFAHWDTNYKVFVSRLNADLSGGVQILLGGGCISVRGVHTTCTSPESQPLFPSEATLTFSPLAVDEFWKEISWWENIQWVDEVNILWSFCWWRGPGSIETSCVKTSKVWCWGNTWLFRGRRYKREWNWVSRSVASIRNCKIWQHGWLQTVLKG